METAASELEAGAARPPRGIRASRPAASVVNVSAQFVETPERQRETTAGAMLFHEYGTVPPGVTAPAPYKNQPNIDVILWDGRLLGLFGGLSPDRNRPRDACMAGPVGLPWNASTQCHIHGTPQDRCRWQRVYTFGTNNGVDWALMVYRMEVNGTVTQIAKVQTRRILHDP